MKSSLTFCIILLCAITFMNNAIATKDTLLKQKLIVQIELTPFLIKHQPPYVALWLSNDKKEHKALLVMREKVKWLRDLKNFWRNIARENRSESDAVTSATNKSKKFNYIYEIDNTWQYISLEVVRENGNRELIYFPLSTKKECVSGNVEIVTFCAQLAMND